MKIDEISKISQQISIETGVPVKKILDMFYLLKAGKPIENKKLIRLLGVSKNALNIVKSKLSNYLKPTTRDTQLVKPLGTVFDENYKPEESLFSHLNNKTYDKSLKLILKHIESMPKPIRNYDQFIATPETTAKRASLLDFFADIKDKRILFLGDDDFTSVAVSGLKDSSNVTVLDIDTRIINSIREISKKEKLKISTHVADFRKGIPSELKNKFDVVFTDPPYTSEGIELFLSRAIQCLNKNNNSGRIYLCYGNSDRAKERFLPIYDLINKSGLMTRWVFDKFNRYNGAESIGSTSSLFVLDVTSKTKPTINKEYERSIYTNN